MKKNIYIEAGVSNLKYNTYPFYMEHRAEDWDYHLFEPNYLSLNRIKNTINKYNIPNLTMYNKALWDKECEKDFWLGRGCNHSGASLLSGKGYLGEEQTKVQCIDFGKWIIDNFQQEDYIHLRMDIEGAEYTVIPSMIKDKSINYINCISLEFHAHKFRGENSKIFAPIHKELRNFFSNCENIKIEALEHIEKIK